MKKYQGEDIYFSLNFNPVDGSGLSSFNDLDNLIVYTYTNSENIVKFSRIEKEGYNPLIDINGDGMILNGVISSENTKTMTGQIMLDIMCIRTSGMGDLSENLIQKAMSGIFVLPSLIKEEI